MTPTRRLLLVLAPVVLLALAASGCATDVENPAVWVAYRCSKVLKMKYG